MPSRVRQRFFACLKGEIFHLGILTPQRLHPHCLQTLFDFPIVGERLDEA
jgi:hypothetical protein